MTNYEKIKSLNKEDMTKVLNHIMDGYDNSIVNNWFVNKYCKGICPDIEFTWAGKLQKWKECDFEGKCPYQNDFSKDIIRLWLDGSDNIENI